MPSALSALHTLWNGVLDVVYPPCCLVCQQRLELGALCSRCIAAIHPLTGPFCDRCGVPIPAARSVCEGCEAGREPVYFTSQALGHYQGTLRQAIHRLKYDGRVALAEPLGLLLASSLHETPLLHGPTGEPAGFDRVVPVPLHPTRLRQRGFNQAERIACVVAREYGWPLDTHGLRRLTPTRSQTRLGAIERVQNVKNAFSAATPSRFTGDRVLLIDDVLTTTATVRACSEALLLAGASRIGVAALARG